MSFKQLDSQDIVVSADSITGTVWSANRPRLTQFYTSSLQIASQTGNYYAHVYQTGSNDSSATVQFDIAYGDKNGSGSVFYNSLVTGSSPTKTIYGQYRTLVLGDENADFIFGGVTSSHFYALSIERARYKEQIALGTMTLKLSGSHGVKTLTDNSKIIGSTVFNDAGRVYQLVSGSEGTVYTGNNVNGYTTTSGSYGMVLPDVGIILLNGEAMSGSNTAGCIGIDMTRQFNIDNSLTGKFYNALTGSGTHGAISSGNTFKLNSQETITADYIFTRARNAEFNFSENPSFISGSTGAVLYDSFINNPQTYITTVGMYNDSSELLAVAKLSRPLLKDFTKELLVRVKLDF